MVYNLTAPFGEHVPNWDRERMENRGCFSCDSTEYSIICYRPDGLSVAQCKNCSALYLPIIPNDEQLKDFYELYSRSKPYMQKLLDKSPIHKSKHQIFKIASKNIIGRRILNYLVNSRPIKASEMCELLIRTGGLDGKKVLEIGPGETGGILKEAKLWGGYGLAVEIDKDATASLVRLGIGVYSDICEVKQKVDVIYMSMVLEHVKDPAAMLKKLANITNTGGRILIKVPNGGQALALGHNWIGFRVDLEHLNYFDQKSLISILWKAGYQTECVWLTSQPILPEYLKMADRNRFLLHAEKTLGRKVTYSKDPFFDVGEFTLTVLARFESKK